MVLLLVLSVVVAGVSKRWIEDPFRHGQHSIQVKTVVLLAGLAATISVIVGAGIVAPSVVAENSAACEQLQVRCTSD